MFLGASKSIPAEGACRGWAIVAAAWRLGSAVQGLGFLESGLWFRALKVQVSGSKGCNV